MNIHFLPDSVYSQGFIDFLSANCSSSDNKFYLISNDEIKYVRNSVKVIKGSKVSICRQIRSYLAEDKNAKVFIHFMSDIHLIVLLLTFRSQRKYWFFWGADLYSYIDYPLYEKESLSFVTDKKKQTFKDKFFLWLRKKEIKNLDYVCINPVEYEILKKNFDTKAKRVNFKYPIKNNVKENNNTYLHSNSVPVILLGNSGDPTNNHISVIDRLAEMDFDFKVITPLSYGNNKKYIEYVLSYGKERLGNKFLPLTEFMPLEKYNELLDSVDVAIMNQYRAQAAGNIRILLSKGKKVIVNEISPLFEYYTSEGIVLTSLQKSSFDNSIFSPYSEEIINKNRLCINTIYSDKRVLEYIKAIIGS